MTKHKCPDDPIGALFHGHQLGKDGGFWLSCSPEVSFAWDQWMECYIRCDHGTFVGTACGCNFQECLELAVEKFNAFDHVPECYEDYIASDGEEAECTLWRGHDGDHWSAYHELDDDACDEWCQRRKHRVEFCRPHQRRMSTKGHWYWPWGQGMLYPVWAHDDDGTPCNKPPGDDWAWDNPDDWIRVDYSDISDHKQMQGWHSPMIQISNYYWENNLKIRVTEIVRQAKAGEELHEPEGGWFEFTRRTG